MKYIMMVAVLALLAGCAGTMSEEDQRKHTTVFVTMKVIEESSLTADDVLEMVEGIRGGAEAQASTEGIRADVFEALGYSDLSPADQYLVTLLIDPMLDLEGEVDLGDEMGVGEGQAELEQWLEWVEQAAYLSGAEQ